MASSTLLGIGKQIIRRSFRKLEYGIVDEAPAIRYWPRERTGRVVLDPERRFGQPIDCETGVPTRTIYDACMAGSGQDMPVVAAWFDVPPGDRAGRRRVRAVAHVNYFFENNIS